MLALDPGTRVQVVFPLVTAVSASAGSRRKGARPRKSARRSAPAPALTEQLKGGCSSLRKAGFNRLYQTGQVFEFSTPESLLDIDFDQPVFMLVDRLAVSPDSRTRIVDAVETAYRESGEVIFDLPPHDEQAPRAQLRFAQRFECKNCNLRYEEPEPRLFSFNNPYGACPRCQGFGNTIDFDLDLVIPDSHEISGRRRDRSLEQAKVPAAVCRHETFCQAD